MHYTKRYRPGILLASALAALALGACGAPDTQTGSAAPPAMASAESTPVASEAKPTALLQFGDDASGAAATEIPSAEATPATTAETKMPTEVAPSVVPTTTTIFETNSSEPFTGTDALSDTDELSGAAALEANHPVAEAIGDYFGVPTEEILDQHQDGLGFGEIARVYFLARELAADDDPSNDLSADAILDMHQAGAGWGQIIQTLGLPNGNRSRNLGQIMSGRARGTADDSTSAAPAQHDQSSKTRVDKLKDHTPNASLGNRSSSGNHGGGNGGNGGKSDKPKKGK
jgi:hypothetical protein